MIKFLTTRVLIIWISVIEHSSSSNHHLLLPGSETLTGTSKVSKRLSMVRITFFALENHALELCPEAQASYHSWKFLLQSHYPVVGSMHPTQNQAYHPLFRNHCFKIVGHPRELLFVGIFFCQPLSSANSIFQFPRLKFVLPTPKLCTLSDLLDNLTTSLFLLGQIITILLSLMNSLFSKKILLR